MSQTMVLEYGFYGLTTHVKLHFARPLTEMLKISLVFSCRQDSLTAGFFAGGLKYDPYGRSMSEVGPCRAGIDHGDPPGKPHLKLTWLVYRNPSIGLLDMIKYDPQFMKGSIIH